MVAGDDRVEERAVAEIRLALAFEALAPARLGGATDGVEPRGARAARAPGSPALSR